MPGNMDFSCMSDEQLVDLARKGNEAAGESLFLRYKNFIRVRVRRYFLEGADSEDVMQEGMIGLYSAMRDFDSTKNVPFEAFADLCVERRLNTAVRTASRKKHSMLNDALSLNDGFSQGTEMPIEDVLMTDSSDEPENIIISREDKSIFEKKLDSILSSFEKKVISLYLDGLSYADIAAETGRDEKSIDNALQRVRTKLKKHA